MSLIKVWTELDDGKCYSLPAKIISKKSNGVMIVKYLSVTENKDSQNRKIYKYEDEMYEITDESVSEYIDSDSELDFGFQQISEDEFVKYDSDSDEDYVPSEDDDESSETCSDDDDEDEIFTDGDDYYDDE